MGFYISVDENRTDEILELMRKSAQKEGTGFMLLMTEKNGTFRRELTHSLTFEDGFFLYEAEEEKGTIIQAWIDDKLFYNEDNTFYVLEENPIFDSKMIKRVAQARPEIIDGISFVDFIKLKFRKRENTTD
jgi:hypothetical protein